MRVVSRANSSTYEYTDSRHSRMNSAMPTCSSICCLLGDAELLLDLHLDREPVGVPPGPAGHVRPVHGAESAEEVLVDPGPDVVQAGHAVGGRRALVEDPWRRALALLNGAFEDAVRRPAGQLGLLEGNEVDVGGDG